MKFETAIEKVMHLVPGCPWSEAVDALRYAVIEFCTRSKVITYWTDKPSNAMTFDIGADAQVMPVDIFDAWVAGTQVDALTLTDATPTDGRSYLVYDPEQLQNSIAVMPAPLTPVPVRMLMAWAPTPWATEFNDGIWMRHQEALKAGALMRLLAEPGTPYVNEARASGYAGVFNGAAISTGNRAAMNRSRPIRRLRVTPAE